MLKYTPRHRLSRSSPQGHRRGYRELKIFVNWVRSRFRRFLGLLKPLDELVSGSQNVGRLMSSFNVNLRAMSQ